MKVKNKLAVRMAEKGIRTVSELHRMIQANDMTMSRRTLDKFYNNESNRIDWDTLGTLCAILDCEPGDLLYLDKSE
ncbi:transcriptional regulator [Bacillus sp. HMSC76G11]|nr:transcriptional regulator [Bacillus sp. HMSC76G11]